MVLVLMKLPPLIFLVLKVKSHLLLHENVFPRLSLGIWSLKCAGREDELDDTVILTFVGQTM